MQEFIAFPKIPRLSRDIVITEKIDGTNASILIADDLSPFTYESGRSFPFLTASRNRWIQPENDNYGFSKWAYAHAEDLMKLGPGHHFGEWWGQGIQRAYGLSEKRFSLFNVKRWNPESIMEAGLTGVVYSVPKLYVGPFDGEPWFKVLDYLRDVGSAASPGFRDPEGVVIFHEASKQLFKKTLKHDEAPKGAVLRG